MSVGTQLRQAREARSLSLDEAAQATHIKPHYLEALEADQFEMLPSAAQLRGFLRAYCNYLKLDPSILIAALEQATIESSQPVGATAPRIESMSASSSEAIFKEVGNTLQSQRELMGLTLGDVERHTHIRVHYVRALEEGDINHLPSPVQGRGMLSNYASFLGLNTEAILLRFADGLQASLFDRQAARNKAGGRSIERENEQTLARLSSFKRLFSMDLFVGGFLILFLLGFTIWGGLRISKLNATRITSPTSLPVSELLLSTPSQAIPAISTLIPVTAISTLPASLVETAYITGTLTEGGSPTSQLFQQTSSQPNAPLQVYVIALQRAWMRIEVDGEVAFEGRVVPGSAYSFSGNQRIELLTGNGAGLQVVFNQQDLGPMGSFGETIDRIFSIEGVQTATPAIPPTNTPIPSSSISPTPTPSSTVQPATPTPTPKS